MDLIDGVSYDDESIYYDAQLVISEIGKSFVGSERSIQVLRIPHNYIYYNPNIYQNIAQQIIQRKLEFES